MITLRHIQKTLKTRGGCPLLHSKNNIVPVTLRVGQDDPRILTKALNRTTNNCFVKKIKLCYEKLETQLDLSLFKNLLTPLNKGRWTGISLTLHECHYFDDASIKAMLGLLGTNSHVSTIKLDFFGCHVLNDETLPKLSELINASNQLRVLKLNFEGCFQLSDDGVAEFFQSIEIDTLASARLNFSDCTEITEDSFEPIVAFIKNQQLNDLRLEFNACPILSSDGLSTLTLEKDFSNLSVLQLNFQCSENLSDEDLTSLGQALKKCQVLTELNLDFSECFDISEEGVENLFKYEPDPFLTKVVLAFKACSRIGDLALEPIGRFLARTTLNSLSLDFSFCTDISSRGITAISQSLGKNLSCFYLNLESLKYITDQDLIQIGYGIHKAFYLTEFDVNINKCVEVTTVGFASLIMSLSRHLQNLRLKVAGCWELSSACVDSLVHALLKFKLEELALDFSWCGKIKDEDLNKLPGLLPKNCIYSLKKDNQQRLLKII
eukprot:TRINITY_DN22023_c0_g1_i1.p1 TRINITY_DN22023_c0_g1~~TRINITY_DN22023_c0_g1_i1.p1  ORF type:complete len:493 (+),score=41.26 TRINITY_DN22023_c0_g1_i1:49-1527(+)